MSKKDLLHISNTHQGLKKFDNAPYRLKRSETGLGLKKILEVVFYVDTERRPPKTKKHAPATKGKTT
jgi:hypothetical protein